MIKILGRSSYEWLHSLRKSRRNSVATFSDWGGAISFGEFGPFWSARHWGLSLPHNLRSALVTCWRSIKKKPLTRRLNALLPWQGHLLGADAQNILKGICVRRYPSGARCLHSRSHAHQRRHKHATGHHHVTGTAKRLERRIEVIAFADVRAEAR